MRLTHKKYEAASCTYRIYKVLDEIYEEELDVIDTKDKIDIWHLILGRFINSTKIRFFKYLSKLPLLLGLYFKE